MRILIDTNVWVSALLWPDSLPHRVLQIVLQDHTVILSPGIMDELRDVFDRKFPHRRADLERFFKQLSYELAPESAGTIGKLSHVLRDPDDVHILISALSANADVLLTGDQDFVELPMTKPLILTPRQFIERFTLTE